MKTNHNRTRLIRRAPLAVALTLALASPVALAAGPQGGTFRLPGSLTGGTIDTSNPNATQVNLTTPGGASTNVAVIDWGTFNIDAGSSVNFNNGTGQAQAVINVDTQGAVTQINGAINTSGANQTSVLVVNPNGVSVGSGAQINTSGAFMAAAGSVETSNPGQVSINLAQAPLVVDDAAQINAGTGAAPGDFTFGVAGVSLRSDGSPATLPVSWTGQETNLNIQVNNGIGDFQANTGWRTESGNPNAFGEGRTRYSLIGSQENFVSTNGGNFDGVGLFNAGAGVLHFDAGTSTIRNNNIQGNGKVSVTAGNIENLTTNTETQVNIQQGGSLNNATFQGYSPVYISSPGGASISNIYTMQASIFVTNLGPGSTLTDSQIYADSVDMTGGIVGPGTSIYQTNSNGFANFAIEGMNGGQINFAAPMYLESSGALINPQIRGTNDFIIVAPLMQGTEGAISVRPADMSDPSAGVNGQIYLGRLEGTQMGVVGDLYVEVDSVGRYNGFQGGATVYRGNLTVRVRSANGSIWTVRGGRLDIVAQENLDDTSIFITGSGGGTIEADSISGGNFTYDQPRVDDPDYEPVPLPIGNGELVINARIIQDTSLGAIDGFFTVNASEAVRNSTIYAYFLKGNADQTRLAINAPLVDRVLASGAFQQFGKLEVNADTVSKSNLQGTSVAINSRDMINTIARAFNGQLDVILSGQMNNSQVGVNNGNANIQADSIFNSSGNFNSSEVAIGARSIDGFVINGSAGTLNIDADSARIVDINTFGTNVNLTANSADTINGSNLGAVRLDIGNAQNVSILGAFSIDASGGDWTGSTLISNDRLNLDVSSFTNGTLNAATQANIKAGVLAGSQVNAETVSLDADRVVGSTIEASGDVSGRVDAVDGSTITGQNLTLAVAEVRNASVLSAVQNMNLTGGTIVIRDSQLLADVLRIQASGDLTVDGASTLDAVSRVALAAAGKLGIGEAGGNVLITSERITGDADRIVIGDNAALIVRTPNAETGSDRIQINGNATYTGDANQQATSGNFYAFGFTWTIIGDRVVLLDPPKNGQVDGEAGITLTARNGVDVNGGTLFAGPGQEDPPVVEPPLVPPSVRVQTVLAGDVNSARYTDAVLLVPAQLEKRQGGVEE